MLEQVLKYGVVSYDVAVRLSALFEEQDKELQTVFCWGVLSKLTKEVFDEGEIEDIVLCLEITGDKYLLLTKDDYFCVLINGFEALYPAPMVHELIPHLPPLIVTENGIPKGLTLDHASGPISDTSPRLMYGKTLSSSVLDVEITKGCVADAYATMLSNLIERFPFGTLREIKETVTGFDKASETGYENSETVIVWGDGTQENTRNLNLPREITVNVGFDKASETAYENSKTVIVRGCKTQQNTGILDAIKTYSNSLLEVCPDFPPSKIEELREKCTLLLIEKKLSSSTFAITTNSGSYCEIIARFQDSDRGLRIPKSKVILEVLYPNGAVQEIKQTQGIYPSASQSLQQYLYGDSTTDLDEAQQERILDNLDDMKIPF